MKINGIVLIAMLCSFGFADERSGLSVVPDANNLALIIGVPTNLPGIDKDVAMVEKMVKNTAYNFVPSKLWSNGATVAKVAEKTKELSSQVDHRGTLFWYFSGHGGKGTLLMQDRTMSIKEIRTAIEAGRESTGPLERLVMLFDSCYSGSLLDPLRNAGIVPNLDLFAKSFADEVVEEFSTQRSESTYWRNLFVIASSTASETSNAGQNGSEFTVAFTKAFNETISANGTVGDFVTKTKKYTTGHHPMERLVPEDIRNEKLGL